MSQIDLTEKQTQIWNNIGCQLAANQNIKLKALQYYLEYRQHLKHNIYVETQDRTQNVFRISYFLSQKTQIIYNIKGQKVNGITLSINSILKKQSNFDDFLYNLKEMMKVVTIEDKSVENQINTLIKKFSFLMTFHNKFQTTLKKIKLKPTLNEQTNILNQSLLWVVFIDSRNTCLKGNMDIVDTTCLLGCLLIQYLKSMVKVCQQVWIEEKIVSIDNKQQIILQYLRMKDMVSFNRVGQTFKKYLQHLKELLSYELCFNDKKTIDAYKKIDSYYQKHIDQNMLDQRHFLKDRLNNNLHQNRFSPFGGIHRNTSWRNTNVISHKILTYQLNQTNDNNNQNAIHEVDGIKIIKNLKANQTPHSTLLKATPMTQAMELYNWLHQKSISHPISPNSDQFIDLILSQSKLQQNSLQQRKKLIYGIWNDTLQSCGQNTQKGKLVYLILSVEITYYVLNVAQSLTSEMLQLFDVNWFELWQKFDKVINYDKKMPTIIKIHLLNVQTMIITQHLWKKQLKLTEIFNQSIREKNTTYQKLYKRIIHHIAYQIYFMTTALKIDEVGSNSIFLVVQHTLISFPDIIINRNLDQIILCSFYAICRATQINLKFNQIILRFKELNNLGKQYYTQLIEHVQIANQKQDIISFYNHVFIKKIKPFLLQIKYQKGQLNQVSHKNNYIASPVKSLLPKQLTTFQLTPNSDTPNIQALYAYNQSPLLKNKKKKNLAMIAGEGLNLALSKKDTNQQQIQNTIQLINKKFKKTTLSPQMKFVNYRNMNK